MILKMNYSKATPSKILHYTNDKSILNDTYNMTSFANDMTKNKIKEFNNFLLDKNFKSRKYYHLIISPEETNIDPKKLIEFAREFLDEKFKNSMATISIHNDNGRNHIHIVLCAKQINNFKIRISKNEYNNLKNFAQIELSQKYNFKTTETNNSLATNKKLLIDYHKKSNREIIKSTVKEIKNNCKSLDEFSKKLFENYNIKIETFTTKNNEQKFSYKINNSSGIGENKLGEIFTKNYLEKYFENKKEMTKSFIPKQNNYTPEELKFIQRGLARDNAQELADRQKAIDTKKAITY